MPKFRFLIIIYFGVVDTFRNISIIFDDSCLFCIYFALLCFTLRYFYIFSRTNLLTSCHSASCLFSSVFWFQKGRKSIFSELDGTKAKVIIFPGATRNHKAEPEGGHRVAAPSLGAGKPWRRLQGVWPPWTSTDLASYAYKKPPTQKP